MSGIEQYVAQQQRRGLNHQAMQIRDTLGFTARTLLAAARVTLTKAPNNAIELATRIGELTAYVAVRKSLTPTVALDGYTQEMEGVRVRLLRQLALIQPESPSKGDDASSE